MMRQTLTTIFLSLALGLSSLAMADPDAVAQEEIDHLLEFVANSACTFIRNSERHDGAEAAEHLRGKFENDRRHVHSAELFIERVATKSSVTGKPYTINCGGKAEPSKKWLHRELALYRNQSDPYRDR